MPYHVFLYLLIKIILIFSPDRIFQSNQLIEEAEMYFLQKEYMLALSKYESLNNEIHIKDANVLLNLAHCYYHVGDTAKAKKAYLTYNHTVNSEISSVVYQQLGVIVFKNNDYQQALTYFKNALRADPGNQAARYNYELVKKMLRKQDTLTKDTINQPLPEPEVKPSEDLAPQASETSTNHQEGFNKEKAEEPTTQEIIQDRLKKINISKDKAEMILEAMKNTEIQYIQQHKKATDKKQDKDMPDW